MSESAATFAVHADPTNSSHYLAGYARTSQAADSASRKLPRSKVCDAPNGSTSQAFSVAALLMISILSILQPTTSHAAINACRTPTGGTIFQDLPCEHTGMSAQVASNAAIEPAPLGLHESWFEAIEPSAHTAFCHAGGCECGSLRRVFDHGLGQALADALFLDGAWHRYESELTASAAPTADRYAQPKAVVEAACEVMMSQETIRVHGKNALTVLRARSREAEERGYDDPAVCNAGDLVACELLDAAELYRRVLSDLSSLRISRHLELDTLGSLTEEPSTTLGGSAQTALP